MTHIHRIFATQHDAQRGSMLVELLMTVALAAIIMPFIFRYQQSAITRAENIAIADNMTEIQSAQQCIWSY